jgi:hypothetical protein
MNGTFFPPSCFIGWGGRQLDDPRLDCAIMRPMESDGDHFLTYYLTKDDESAEQFKESRADPRGIESLQEEEEVRPLSPPNAHIPDLDFVSSPT